MCNFGYLDAFFLSCYVHSEGIQVVRVHGEGLHSVELHCVCSYGAEVHGDEIRKMGALVVKRHIFNDPLTHY
jgi:hypothetical protein